MSKRQRKQQSRSSAPMTAAQKLVHYAKRVVREGIYGAAGTKLFQQIDTCLEKRDDASLMKALRMAEGETLEDLELAIRQEASTNDGILDLARVEPLCTELFAVPVVFALPGGEAPEVPQALDSDWVIETLRKHDLSMKQTGDTYLGVLPQLWSYNDLSKLTFTQVADITRSFEGSLSDKRRGRQMIMRMPIEPEKETVAEDTIGLYLRFIIGACTYSYDKYLPFERDELKDNVAHWEKALASLLDDQLPGAYMVHAPENFYKALESGITYYHIAALGMTVRDSQERTGFQAGQVVACVSLHGDDGGIDEIRIAGYDENGAGETVFTFQWDVAPFEDPFEMTDLAISFLKKLGIQDCRVSDEIHPDLRCDCCGDPVYLSPEGQATSHVSAALPAPTSIQ